MFGIHKTWLCIVIYVSLQHGYNHTQHKNKSYLNFAQLHIVGMLNMDATRPRVRGDNYRVCIRITPEW